MIMPQFIVRLGDRYLTKVVDAPVPQYSFSATDLKFADKFGAAEAVKLKQSYKMRGIPVVLEPAPQE